MKGKERELFITSFLANGLPGGTPREGSQGGLPGRVPREDYQEGFLGRTPREGFQGGGLLGGPHIKRMELLIGNFGKNPY